jgi:hypothetical protein
MGQAKNGAASNRDNLFRQGVTVASTILDHIETARGAAGGAFVGANTEAIFLYDSDLPSSSGSLPKNGGDPLRRIAREQLLA